MESCTLDYKVLAVIQVQKLVIEPKRKGDFRREKTKKDPENQYTHDGTRVVRFSFNHGDVLRIEEGLAIICVHSLVLNKRTGKQVYHTRGTLTLFRYLVSMSLD